MKNNVIFAPRRHYECRDTAAARSHVAIFFVALKHDNRRTTHSNDGIDCAVLKEVRDSRRNDGAARRGLRFHAHVLKT